MMSDDFGLCVGSFGVLIANCFGDPTMDLLAPCLEEALIRDLLHERVLEGIGRLRRQAATEHQPSRDKFVQALGKLRLREFGDGGQQVLGKLASYNGADLCHLLCCGQSVETCHQGGL
jgi:hypothetical protein